MNEPNPRPENAMPQGGPHAGMPGDGMPRSGAGDAMPGEELSPEAKQLQRRAAEAMVAAYLQVARSTELAFWLQQTRERSLERRAERASDMKEIVSLQYQIDAQQPQATLLSNAAGHYRAQAKNLASFTKAGLTMEDFERLGVGDIVDPEELRREIERLSAPPDGMPTSEPGPATDGEADARDRDRHTAEASDRRESEPSA